jgi:GntR family transcriptional regulator
METHHIKDRIPSENELAKAFKVSRMTARKALDELHNEGYVERIPGKGTFLKNRKPYSHQFFRLHPFSENAEVHNVKTASKIVDSNLVATDHDLAARLEYHHAVRVRRVHHYDENPVCFEDRYLRADICGAIINEDLEEESIHRLLIHKFSLPLTKVWQRLEALALPKEIAGFLEVAPNDPALLMRQTTFSFKKPISHVNYFMRNDFYVFEDTFEPRSDALSATKN